MQVSLEKYSLEAKNAWEILPVDVRELFWGLELTPENFLMLYRLRLMGMLPIGAEHWHQWEKKLERRQLERVEPRAVWVYWLYLTLLDAYVSRSRLKHFWVRLSAERLGEQRLVDCMKVATLAEAEGLRRTLREALSGERYDLLMLKVRHGDSIRMVSRKLRHSNVWTTPRIEAVRERILGDQALRNMILAAITY